MKQDTASHTAQHMALIRAAHQLLDTPLILADPIALPLVGTEGVAQIRAGGIKIHSSVQRHLRAFAVARSRIVEDELAQAVARGVRQFVILGAGLDTFAYRNPHSQLKVFEVDHPDTQAMKRERLAACGVTPPPTLTFVSIDFETDDLGERLYGAGFQTQQPTLFSWLGVSMYLEREAVQRIFQFVQTATASGSALIFDYIEPLSTAPPMRQLKLRVLAGLLALKGEPWRSYFDPQELVQKLIANGYRQIEDWDAEKINSRFFTERSDSLKVGGSGHVMVAHR